MSHAARWSFRWQLALTGLTVLLSARAASASDEKTYMGSLCMPRSSSDYNRLSAKNGFVSIVSGTTDVQVACPVVKAAPDNSGITSAVANFDLGTTSKTVTCSLVAFSSSKPNGSNRAPLGTSGNKSVTGTGAKSLSFGTFTAGAAPFGSAGTSWTVYELGCTLPVGATLRNYIVNEAGTRSETQKTYPASMCRLNDLGNSGAWTFEAEAFMQTHEGSSHTSRTKMFCPVITDRVNNTLGLARADLSVTRPFVAGLSHTCTMFAKGNDNFVLSSVSRTTSSGMEFPSLTLNLAVSAGRSFARFYIDCDMPGTGDSRILGYRIEEASGGSADAANNDGKVYPGSLCFGDPYPKIVRSTTGVAVNINSFNRTTAFCPIIGDHTTSTTGISRARIHINSAPTAGSTVCTISSFTAGGSLPFSTSDSDTSTEPANGGSGDQFLEVPLATSPAAARYVLKCDLGPDDVLYEYEITER